MMARMSMSSDRPFASRIACLVLAACAQLAVLLWAARAHIEQALNCEVCDTFYYYNAAAAFADTGLLFSNPYDGYRSYFVPFVIAGVVRLASALGVSGEQAAGSIKPHVIPNASEHIRELASRGAGITNTVGGKQRELQPPRYFYHRFVARFFFAIEVPLKLGVDVATTEDVYKLVGRRDCLIESPA